MRYASIFKDADGSIHTNIHKKHTKHTNTHKNAYERRHKHIRTHEHAHTQIERGAHAEGHLNYDYQILCDCVSHLRTLLSSFTSGGHLIC